MGRVGTLGKIEKIGANIAGRRYERSDFEQLYQRHQRRVYSIALSFFDDEATAQDITQAVFLKVYTKIERFKADAEFSTWLYRIVWNACLDHHRRMRIRTFLSLDAMPAALKVPDPADPVAAAQRAQTTAVVRRALSELKVEFRMPLILRYLEGMSYAEIAAALGCQKGTVASRISRGHQRLSRKLAHLAPKEEP